MEAVINYELLKLLKEYESGKKRIYSKRYERWDRSS